MADGFKFSPRCDPADPCCAPGDCGLIDRDFEGDAASTTLGSGWIETAGDWAYDGLGRLVTSDSAAEVRPRTEGPPGSWQLIGGKLADYYLRAVVEATADDDEIIIGSNYGFPANVGLRVGPDALIWFGRGDRSTVRLECPVTAAANTTHEIICDCGVIYLNGTAVLNILGYEQNFWGLVLFLGTGAVTGEVRFHEVAVEATQASHPESGCPSCPLCPLFLGETPLEFPITFANFVDFMGINWSIFNGTYVLKLKQHFRRAANPGLCRFELKGLNKLFDRVGDGSHMVPMDRVIMTISNSRLMELYIVSADWVGLGSGVSVSFPYNLFADTEPTVCAGDDVVFHYGGTAYLGSGMDLTNSQAAATGTIDL